MILVPFYFVIIFSRKSKKLTHRSVGNIISFEPVVATTILAESFGQVQTTFCAQTKVCPKCWKPPNKNAIFEPALNHRFIKPGLLSLSCQVLPMHNFFVLQNICWLKSVLFCHLRKHWTEIIPLTTYPPYVSGVRSISLLLVLMSCLILKGGEAQT